MRNCTRGADKPLATRASIRSSSSKLSTTMWRTPMAMASRNSAVLLLLPCTTQRDAGTPALRATNSSPPVATSSSKPSSWAKRAIAVHKNAFVAYTTASAPNSRTASAQRARKWASSYTNSGVPCVAAKSCTSQPPIRSRPSTTSAVSGSR